MHLLSDEVLKVEEGSLYPALHRLELDGAVAASWGRVREQPEGEVLAITRKGRKLVAEEQDAWSQLSAAVHRVLAR